MLTHREEYQALLFKPLTASGAVPELSNNHPGGAQGRAATRGPGGGPRAPSRPAARGRRHTVTLGDATQPPPNTAGSAAQQHQRGPERYTPPLQGPAGQRTPALPPAGKRLPPGCLSHLSPQPGPAGGAARAGRQGGTAGAGTRRMGGGRRRPGSLPSPPRAPPAARGTDRSCPPLRGARSPLDPLIRRGGCERRRAPPRQAVTAAAGPPPQLRGGVRASPRG